LKWWSFGVLIQSRARYSQCRLRRCRMDF